MRQALSSPVLLLPIWLLACAEDNHVSTDGGACPGRVAGQVQDKVERYLPAPNQVAGWVEDSAVGAPGVEAGYSYDAIVAIIDGSQEPYAQAGCVGFAKQDYAKGSFSLTIHLWEMKDAAAAKKMFEKDRGDLLNEGITDSEPIPCVYDQSVAGSDRMMIKGYVAKSQYLFKFVGRCNALGDVPAMKTELIAFVRALADRQP